MQQKKEPAVCVSAAPSTQLRTSANSSRTMANSLPIVSFKLVTAVRTERSTVPTISDSPNVGNHASEDTRPSRHDAEMFGSRSEEDPLPKNQSTLPHFFTFGLDYLLQLMVRSSPVHTIIVCEGGHLNHVLCRCRGRSLQVKKTKKNPIAMVQWGGRQKHSK